jgi:Macrocin-O-methyltransferase (TylF)
MYHEGGRMIVLPDFKKAFEYENNFYLSCDISRISKIIAHYELYKMAMHVPGVIIECGVFKGVSFSRFAAFRDIFGNPHAKRLIGFDTFGRYPDTQYKDDQTFRSAFISSAGDQSISEEQMMQVLRNKGTERNVELVPGDVTRTVPAYVKEHPELKISLLNLDTDIYEPAVTALEYLYPRLVKGGILLLDDYGSFPGETQAVDDYFQGKRIKIRKFPFCVTPSYIIKE